MSSIQHFTGPCSAYFPSLHRSIDDQMLCRIVGEIGSPSRIDWVEMTQPKKNYRSAFVHFDWGRADLIGDGPTDMSRYIEGTDNYAITMLPARNPVPNTVLNIHQVANNLKVLEDSLWGSMNKQADQIRDLEDIVQAQREQLANQAAMIKLLLEKQSYPSPPILRRQTNSQPFDIPVIPFPNMDDESDADDESMPDLESGSVSTHSSMPPLIECDPDSWDNNDDMYPVVEYVSDNSCVDMIVD
jgi:hypothetical protein